MILFIAFVLIKCPVNNGQLASSYLDALNSIVASRPGDEMKNAGQLSGKMLESISSVGPASQMIALALEHKLPKDKLGEVVNMTAKIEALLEAGLIQQQEAVNRPPFQLAVTGWYQYVTKPLGIIRHSFDTCSRSDFNADPSVLDGFKKLCTGSASAPMIIATQMDYLPTVCGEPKIDFTLLEFLEDRINEQQYTNEAYAYPDALYNQYLAVVYISFERSTFSTTKDRLESFRKHKGTTFLNKTSHLKEIVNFFGFMDTFFKCIYKEAYIASGFDRNTIIDFNTLVMTEFFSVGFLARVCSDISITTPEAAEKEYQEFAKRIKPVETFLSNWTNALLTSLWPKAHTIKVAKYMNQARVSTKNNETCASRAKKISKLIRQVGHPEHHFDVIVTPYHSDHKSSYYYLQCHRRDCNLQRFPGKSNVLLIKHNVTSPDFRDKEGRLERHLNKIYPIYRDLLDGGMYREPQLSVIVKELEKKYSNFFNKHHYKAMVLVRNEDRMAECPIVVGYNTTAVDASKIKLKALEYYTTYTVFTWCEAFTMFFV